MKRYYITDRRSCPGPLLDCIEANARDGVDWIQIREKDLAARDLLELVRAAVARVAPYGSRLLVSERLDVALAAGAHGVHLPSDALPPAALRSLRAGRFLVGVSTHTVAEVAAAEREGADFAVFGPVYPTPSKPGLVRIPGLAGLRSACAAVGIPVAALGGLTSRRMAACAAAGAAAAAGISMFQRPGGS